MKNNFAQALKELTGFDGPSGEAGNASGSTLDERELKTDYYTPAPSERIIEFSDADSTHISTSMVINGELKSEDNVRVEGQIYGNISTAANLVSTNLIVGDIKAVNANLLCSRTRGNVALEGCLDVGTGSILVGDVSADSIKVSGKIKGNLDVKRSIKLSSEALISGDITSDDICAEPGSRINGTIKTRSEISDLDAEFDFGGDF